MRIVVTGFLLATLGVMQAVAGIIQINIDSAGTAANPNETAMLVSPGPMVPDIAISKNPAWPDPFAGSQWISTVNSGNPNSAGFAAIAAGTTVWFFEDFTLTNFPITSAILKVMADDNTNIIVNGSFFGQTSTVAGALATQGQYDVAAFLHPGLNSLQFDAHATETGSFGANYQLIVQMQTPEPGTGTLILAGILLLFFASNGRR
jgi:hypothetical protein